MRGPANGAAPPPPEGHTGRTLLMGRPRCLIGGRDEQAGGVGVGGWAVGACRARRRCPSARPPARPLGPAGGDTPARARTLAPGFFKADIISSSRRASFPRPSAIIASGLATQVGVAWPCRTAARVRRTEPCSAARERWHAERKKASASAAECAGLVSRREPNRI